MELLSGTVEEAGAMLEAAVVVMGDTLGLYGLWRALDVEPGEVPIRDVAQIVGFGSLRRGADTTLRLALEAGP